MKNRAVWSVLGLLVLSGPAWADCGFCGSGGKESAEPHGHTHATVGEPAPDFALKNLAGETHRLSDLKGKVVVLEWMNHECPVTNRCHGNDGEVEGVLAKFKGKPMVWLGIDSSHFAEAKAERIRKWAEENKIAYPILLDAPGTVGRTYDAKTTPHMFVIDQGGVLAYSGALDDDPHGREETKRNYVEEAVKTLLNGSVVSKATTRSYGCSVKYKK